MNIIETERLILRPWREDDAADLYKYAADPQVGPPAGWEPHKGVTDSLHILQTVLIEESTWAITIKGSDTPVGSISVFPTDCSTGRRRPEFGYWIARPFWGHGYIPEAVRALMARCFSEGADEVWCAHIVGNEKSRRVIEKCGFTYRCTEDWTANNGKTNSCMYYSIRREDWEA